MLIMLANQRRVGRCLWLMALLLFATGTTHARTLRKVHATIPYTVEGKQTVIGADGTPGKFGLGAQVVFYHTMMDSSGKQTGNLAGHCHVVAKGATNRDWIAVCTKHFDFSDGSTMTGHATETVGPDNKPISARIVIAGGIGKWEGAHGEDAAYFYDPVKGKGSGNIVLYCLKGVC